MRHFLWLWGPLEPQEESHKWSFFFNAQFHTRPIFFPPANLFFGIFWWFVGGKKTVQSSWFRVLSLEVVASVPKFAFFLCLNLSNIYQNLSNSVTVNFLIGGPLAFRLFKPIVNDDYHQEHKEFWWRVSLSHFSLWNEEEKAFCVCGISFLCFFLSLGRVIEREIPQLQPSD